MTRSVIPLLVLLLCFLAGCTAMSNLTDPTTLPPLETGSNVTVIPVTVSTEVIVERMPAATVPTSTAPPQPPSLHRDAEIALWRCVAAFDDDFMPYTMRDTYERSDNAVLLCKEAGVQLRVEHPSEYVSHLQTQVDGAIRAINLTRLDGRPSEDEAATLVGNLNRFATQITDLVQGASDP